MPLQTHLSTILSSFSGTPVLGLGVYHHLQVTAFWVCQSCCFSKLNDPLYSFPIAAITNCHKFWWLKTAQMDHLTVRSLEVQSLGHQAKAQMLDGLAPSQCSDGRIHVLVFSIEKLPAFRGALLASLKSLASVVTSTHLPLLPPS